MKAYKRPMNARLKEKISQVYPKYKGKELSAQPDVPKRRIR